jgi:hypothetical protein
MWLCGDSPLKELGLDLAEWIRKRQGSLKEVDLFDYTEKRGYKVGLQGETSKLKIDQQLAS